MYENGKKWLIRNGQLISKLEANISTLTLVKQAHLWSDRSGKQQPLLFSWEVSEWADLFVVMDGEINLQGIFWIMVPDFFHHF